MKHLISHRGNTSGKFESYENEPNYIDLAISKGYDVEVDVWFHDGILWLGHDTPQYGGVNYFLEKRIEKLWVHCKNIESFIYFNENQYNFNYFWHEKDTLTFTSKGYIWVYPGNQPVKNSIAVLPEINNDNISQSIGICSDFIEKYKKNELF